MNKQYFLERIKTRDKHVFQKYDYTDVPETFLATDKIPIHCFKHGVFYQKAASHMHGSGCRLCGLDRSRENTLLSTTAFIAKSMNLFGDRYHYDSTVYNGKDKFISINCPIHGYISTTPRKHYQYSTGCLECDKLKFVNDKYETLLGKAIRTHGDRYDYSKVKYINFTTDVEIICKIHGSFLQNLYTHAQGSNCPMCAKDVFRKTYDDFILRSRLIHSNAYDYERVSFTKLSDKVEIICKRHGSFMQRASSHLVGNGCKKCFHERCMVGLQTFVSEARKIHGNKYDYSKVVYTGNKIPVEILCPSHGSFWVKPNGHVSSGAGCKKCYESKGERAVELVLCKYGIRYVREYVVSPHRYRFDFYLPDFNIFIEYNGHQHYYPVEIFGGLDEHLKVKERDIEKALIVKSLGGKLIVLPYQTLVKGSIEIALLASLKRVYRFWFTDGCKIFAHLNELDVYKHYGISLNVDIGKLTESVVTLNPNISILF